MIRPRLTISRLMVVVLFVGLGLAGLKIAQLSARNKQTQDEAARKHDTLTTIIRTMRERLNRPDNALYLPDGYVIEVHPERQELLISITRPEGARPRLRMSIFDSNGPGISYERPKGLIEVTRVDERSSTARVIRTTDANTPIQMGDIVYSPAWSPNTPTRFALVGMMDADRDDKDDRDELKRMIQAAGGLIDFDFPPPDVGQEDGTLSPLIDWYVVDDRAPQSPQLAKRMGEIIKESRLNGTRPMPLGRLLAFLGYEIRQPPVHPRGTFSQNARTEARRRASQ